MDDGPEGEGQDPLERPAAFLHGGDGPAETGFGQNDPCRRFRDIGRREDRYAHLRLAQRRGVIRAIAAHADHVSGALERLNQCVLVLGQHAREDPELFRADVGRQRRGGADRAGDPHGIRDDTRGHRRIPCHHHGPHAQSPQLGDERRRLGAGRIA